MAPFLRRTPRPTVFILAVAVAFYGVFIARTAFRVDGRLYFSLFDDAMISMDYARNFAHGHGLVWNAGEHPVEGYTNLLWTLWMAFLHLLRLPEATISLAVMLSGVACLLGTTIVTGAIVRRLSSSTLAPPLAMAFTGLYYPLVYWTLRGMEVGLLALLFSSAVLLALRLQEQFSRRDLWVLAGLLIAAMLTRTDAVVVCSCIAAYAVAMAGRDRRRVAITLAGAVGATLVAHTAFRLLYYGLPLPNTYYLKVSGVSVGTRVYRGLVALANLELVHLWAPTIIAGAFIAAAWRRAPRGVYLLAAVFAASCAYSVYVGGDAWEQLQYSNRYIAPAVPSLFALTAVGVVALLRREAGQARATRFLAPVAFAAVLLLTVRTLLPTHLIAFAPTQIEPLQVWAVVLVPMWLRASSLAPVREGGRAGSVAHRVAAYYPLLIAVFVFLSVEFFPVTVWAAKGASYSSLNAAWTRYGLALRQATAPDATIAVEAAGTIPYFSHRRSIDLFGKADHHIATMHLVTRIFRPGHNKWDYAYSVGKLRPDLLAQAWPPGSFDRRKLQAWGYIEIARRSIPRTGWSTPAFVRRGDRRVNKQRLERFFADEANHRSN